VTLDEARDHVEAAVTYRPCLHCEQGTEHGVITSVGEHFVFVRYGKTGTAKATNPAHLTLAPHNCRFEYCDAPRGRCPNPE